MKKEFIKDFFKFFGHSLILGYGIMAFIFLSLFLINYLSYLCIYLIQQDLLVLNALDNLFKELLTLNTLKFYLWEGFKLSFCFIILLDGIIVAKYIRKVKEARKAKNINGTPENKEGV